MTEKQMIKEMFRLQDELNIHTNGKDWKNKQIPWYRAIWTECAEMMEWTDWKWWKKQDEDYEEIKMELIDIWHFVMSDIMRFMDYSKDEGITYIEKAFKDEKVYYNNDLKVGIEDLATCALAKRTVMITIFTSLCKIVNMSVTDIYKLYLAKNVLNRFRQDNKYGIGKYIKDWNGKEDNYYVMRYLRKTNNVDNLAELLYTYLQNEYKKYRDPTKPDPSIKAPEYDVVSDMG
jgi:dimeric dUTPase (all-alpha-NTP-PPase superfamily)